MRWRGWSAGAAAGLDRLLVLALKGRVAVLLGALAVTAAALHLVLTGLSLDTNTSEMISPEAAFRRNYAAYRQAFPQDSNLLVLVLDGPSIEAVEDAAAALLAGLRESATFPEAWAPGSEPYFRRHGLLYLDVEELGEVSDRIAAASPLLGTLAADPNIRGLFEALGQVLEHLQDEALPEDLLLKVVGEIATVAERAAADRPGRLSWRGLFDLGPEAGKRPRRIILAQPRLDFASLSPAQVTIEEVRRLAQKLGIGAAADLRLRLTGSVALDYEELKSAELGGKTAAGLSLFLVLLLLAFGLRSVRLIVAALLTLVIGLIWTGAFAALAVGHLNLISIAYAVLFVGLGVDFSIHFCLRYREEAQADSLRQNAIRRAGLSIGRALAIAALGAALAFYAFLPTDYRGFAELGLISGTGMFIALLLNFTLLPALLAVLPGGDGGALPRRDVWFLFDRFAGRRRRAILAGSLFSLLVALPILFWLEFDFNPVNLKDPGSESFTTFQELARESGADVYAAKVLTPSLEAAEALADKLAAQQPVHEARTIADFVPQNQAQKLAVVEDMAIFLGPLLQPRAHEGLTAVARARALDALLGRLDGAVASLSNDAGGLGAAVLRLERTLKPFAGKSAALADLDARLAGFLPRFLEDLRAALQAAPVELANLPASLTRHWIGVDGSYRVEVLPENAYAGTSQMREFVKAVLALAPNASGTSVTVSEAGDIVIAAFAEATLLAVIAVAALLFVLYRRLDQVALALAPLVLAAVLTLATASLLGLALNFANVIVLPLLFGLGIASSVHLVERQSQLSDTTALMLTSTPRAVTFSTLTTLASFGSLAISAHRGMSSMGQLLTVAIVYTLLCTLMVLPSLMSLLPQSGSSESEAMPGRSGD